MSIDVTPYAYTYPVPDLTLDEVKAVTEYMRSAGVEEFSYRGLTVKLGADWSAAPRSFGDNRDDDGKKSDTYKNALAALADDEMSDAELEQWSTGK